MQSIYNISVIYWSRYSPYNKELVLHDQGNGHIHTSKPGYDACLTAYSISFDAYSQLILQIHFFDNLLDNPLQN